LNLGVFYPGTKLYYIWRNKQKRAKWEALSPEVCVLRSGHLDTC
jgi:hypothetical protein